MKMIQKSLITLSLLLVTLTTSAQKVIVQDLESWMNSLISKAIDSKVEVSKSFGQERDIQKEGKYSDELVLYSIVDSLTNTKGINYVRIYIDGDESGVFRGSLDISE